MKREIYVSNGLPFVVGILVAFLLLPTEAAAQFDEQFDSATLDPAWQVVEFTGSRVYGYPSPANHISLTDNPGHLRYYVDSMTHNDGFAYNFETSYGFHSCCNHDPGLELRRVITGEHWVLEAKASYFLPSSNGRDFALFVYFGNGNVGTYTVAFHRGRDFNDPPAGSLQIRLTEKTGADPWNYPFIEEWVTSNLPATDFTTFYFRLERSGGMLTGQWSDDNTTWNTTFSRDMGTSLQGLPQTVIFSGLSWFNPAASYADWDYITVTPTLVPVDIDVKPGSDVNGINPNSNGVIPVAILTTEEFQATTVDPSTVRFGPSAAPEAHRTGQIEDVDGDGDLDMVLHFMARLTGIKCGDTEAILTGSANGRTIRGTDAIVTVGNCG